MNGVPAFPCREVYGTQLSCVNGSCVTHLSREVCCNRDMQPNTRKTLAENMRRIIGERSQSSWADERGIDKKIIQRAISARHATTIDTLDALASATGLRPWQLLVPGLDPANPPVHCMTQTERDLYAKIRQEFAQLPPTNGHN